MRKERFVVESGYADERHSSQSEIARKKSLVRHERSRIDPEQRDYYYRKHVLDAQNVSVNPSTTGLDPTTIGLEPSESLRNISLRTIPHSSSFRHQPQHFPSNLRNLHPATTTQSSNTAYSADNDRGQIFYDENGATSSGYNTNLAKIESSKRPEDNTINKDPFLAEGERTIADDDSSSQTIIDNHHTADPKTDPFAAKPPPRFPSLWMVFCYLITFWAPGRILSLLGMPKASHSAWREKMGLIAVILSIGAIVGFLTFGLTQSICDTSVTRLRNNQVGDGFLIVNGRAYDLTRSTHPAAAGIPSGSNVLYPPISAAGMDGSFLFQNVNYDCKGLITPKDNCTIPHDSEGNVGWYFPCKLFAQNGTTQVNQTWDYYAGYACHTSSSARDAFYSLNVAGDVYFTWEDIHNATRNLIVYGGDVLDLDLLDWIDTSNLDIPSEFTDFKANRESLRGTDISLNMTSAHLRQLSRCMSETIKIGSIDSDTVGCIASKVVLYVSLVFILAIVGLKFAFACFFNWVIAWRTGAPIAYDKENSKKREEEIEEWSNSIHRHATLGEMSTPVVPQEENIEITPSTFNTNATKPFASNSNLGSRVSTISNYANNSQSNNVNNRASASGTTLGKKFRRKDNPVTMSTQFQSSTSKLIGNESSNIYDFNNDSRLSFASSTMGSGIGAYPMATSAFSSYGPAGSIHESVVPQPPLDYQPFGFPLAHTICLVTAYSEDEEGLRTTFDSVATTDYPNSHKLIFVICDGIIKGSGNDRSTPDIVVDMMTDLLVPRDEVQAYNYVAVAQGSKRQNMAKVYCGFYSYDDASVESSQQQRVPMVCVVKCGTPAEEAEAKKPGNRGKRDSQVILMNFLQKVMFDERMTELDYEMFNGIWRITGMSPDFYEICLMVDADTKVFPDSLTHMAAAMVEDPQVMGLCGETKIANKRESWVTAIQVFEYFISHHQTKAFESCFGGVTCLPGCFSMYRIKAPKGPDGYWVPILANPDIVEHYADNVVDTLHRKNLLLLGEDRYLTTLMLRTFPKRKQIFVPRAVCKTTVPAQFRVLLSQRRRWINSTVHNLFELLFVNDLCGVFCISMQFVVFIELIGTLVLPAALAFTLYVLIISIVQRPVPIIPLVLLALVLGLPGLLIVVTAKHASYLVWMTIYILALPIWNFVLPSYAYWKFDDFSWGETRAVAGEKKGAGHEDGDGEFDSSQIVMKQWKDFERERREQLAFKANQGRTESR